MINFISQGSNNGFAFGDGDILFGEQLYENLSRNYDFSAIAGVLAHEWGHQIQYEKNWWQTKEDREAHMEPEADFFEGFYSGHPDGRNEVWANNTTTGMLQAVFDSGNDEYPGVHGTRAQRRSAARAGWIVGRKIHQFARVEVSDVTVLHKSYTAIASQIEWGNYNYRQSTQTKKITLNKQQKELLKQLEPYKEELIKIARGEMSDAEYNALGE